jgi:peptidoglycan/xylan/chitin deacetylase (PgdA/CDA1 family)
MWRRLVTATALLVLLAGLVATQATPAQAATYYNSRCGNTSGRVLLTFDDWAYGDPYRATRTGAYLQSRNIRAAFFLINQHAKNYPGIVATLRQQGHWVLNHTYSHPNLTQLSDSSVSSQIRNGIASNRLRPPYGAYNSRAAWAIASVPGRSIPGTGSTSTALAAAPRASVLSSAARHGPPRPAVWFLDTCPRTTPTPSPASSTTCTSRDCSSAATGAPSDGPCPSRPPAPSRARWGRTHRTRRAGHHPL